MGLIGRWWCIVLCGGLLATACSDDTDATSQRNVMDLNKDGPGTCLLVDETIDVEITKLPVIDCAEEHTHEIYANIVVSDDRYPVYPGTETLGALAQRECTIAFQPYVGTGPFDSALFFSWLLPTLASWNDFDDRVVLCVASRFDNAMLTGSVKGSRI